jgi:hypothetical protein
VEYTLLEYRRDPAFRQFCTDLLAELRSAHNLPHDVGACMAIELSPGMTVARILLDRFCETLDEPQWIREKQLILHDFSK